MDSGFTTGGSDPQLSRSRGRGTDGGTSDREIQGAEVESGRGAARTPDAPTPAANPHPAAGVPSRDLTPGPTPGVAYRPDGTRTFLEGNVVGMRHGVHSRFVAVEAAGLADEIMAASPHLADVDRMAVDDLSIATVKVRRLAAWLDEVGDLDDDGEPRKALAELRRWMDRAEKARARLGLDPMSRAALAVDEITARRQATALQQEAADAGRRLREAAEARGDLTPDEED